MSRTAYSISEIVKEADRAGPESEPAQLLKLLAGPDDPVLSISDPNQVHQFLASLYDEFPYLRALETSERPIQSSERSELSALLRWLIRELRQCGHAADARGVRFTGCFIVAQAFDRDKQLWPLLPEDLGNNKKLCEALKQFIGSFSITHSPRNPDKSPIGETEALERFKLADAQGDWREIAESWRPRQHLIADNLLQRQAVRCLFRCGTRHLVEATVELHQTAVAMQIASVLNTNQRLELAVACTNRYLQFACIYHSLCGQESKETLSAQEEGLLTQLLINVAADDQQWCAWMQVFNKYPVRYPALQKSLGDALAQISEVAIEAYVNSIALGRLPAKPDPGRDCVAKCLRAFRGSAPSKCRDMLWTRAHDRWINWNFDQSDPGAHLTAVNWSELDYALVGFACEVMDEVTRTTAMDKVCHELQELDHAWQVSETHARSAWNRLFSQYQPYAHASHCLTAGPDWLVEDRIYWPFDPKTERYLAIKYGIYAATL